MAFSVPLFLLFSALLPAATDGSICVSDKITLGEQKYTYCDSCCGPCGFQVCCPLSFLSNTPASPSASEQLNCLLSSLDSQTVGLLVGGVVLIVVIILLVTCCCCSGCCLYDTCRTPRTAVLAAPSASPMYTMMPAPPHGAQRPNLY